MTRYRILPPPTDDEELIRLQEWEQRIRRAALEEAADIADRVSEIRAGTEHDAGMVIAASQIAHAIRALKEKE